MRPFFYCPACATKLEDPRGEGGKRCPGCGRTWYRNAAPTAGCAIVRDGRALVTVRGIEPEKGKCDVPGGFLEHDEDPVAAVKREVREELGVEVDLGVEDFVQAIPHPYGDDGQWVLALGFRARIVSGEPTPASDVADIRWVARDELDEVEFAWDHDKELVRRALEDVDS